MYCVCLFVCLLCIVYCVTTVNLFNVYQFCVSCIYIFVYTVDVLCKPYSTTYIYMYFYADYYVICYVTAKSINHHFVLSIFRHDSLTTENSK